MPRKNYRWLDVKSTKSLEEWRRINRIYNQRRNLRNHLKLRGAELLDKIHNYRLVQSPGPADSLIEEVHKVLRLPYCWSQEDLDHAEARLSDIEVKLMKIKQRITPKSTQFTNALMMFLLQSKEPDSEKVKALASGLEHIANQLSVEKVESLENDKPNYIATLLRTKDGYYPKWFVKYLYNNILQVLGEEDLEKLTKMLMKVVVANHNKKEILNAISVDEEDDEIVIG